MSRVLQFDDIQLLIARVQPLDNESRRLSERRAVADLISKAFGQDAQLAHRDSGAPYILGDNVNISISHSRHYAALAWSALRTVGVDIEEPRSQLRRVAPRILSEAELQIYSNTDTLLLKAWTLKEALYKAALTPGLDFRRDINLPLSDDMTEAKVADRTYSVIASFCLDPPPAQLSLTSAL